MEARPNSPKTKRGASGGFLPRPLLLRLRHPNSEKRNQPKFCGILSPENCFRKTSSALFQISSGFSSKKVRILSRAYRQKTKSGSDAKNMDGTSCRPYFLRKFEFRFVAESVGFEPTRVVKPCLVSSEVPSASSANSPWKLL